jgi:phosphatidylserine decarboxylase
MKLNSLILKEGFKNIAIVFTIAFFLKLFISDCLGVITLLIGIFLLFVYRDTSRHIFKNTQSVLAPVDSKIIAIDKVNGKMKIYCKVNLLDNHILRAPIDADMKVKKYRHGLNLNPNSYKASLYNEQVVLKFDDMKVKLISGLYNNKIKRIHDKTISQGDKVTLFIDGIVVITLKDEFDLLVKIGDNLTSGQTILFKK